MRALALPELPLPPCATELLGTLELPIELQEDGGHPPVSGGAPDEAPVEPPVPVPPVPPVEAPASPPPLSSNPAI